MHMVPEVKDPFKNIKVLHLQMYFQNKNPIQGVFYAVLSYTYIHLQHVYICIHTIYVCTCIVYCVYMYKRSHTHTVQMHHFLTFP